jgi:hypothetical protein
VEVQGTLPNDATLLSLRPHMHCAGKGLSTLSTTMAAEVLLRVNHHFTGSWLPSGRATAVESRRGCGRLPVRQLKNPHNPIRRRRAWGDQTSDEMMVGFFDVAVPAGMDKWKFFVRPERRLRAAEVDI